MPGPSTFRISRSDYYLMGEIGILQEGDRTELIEGNVYVREPIGPWHATTVDLLGEAFAPVRRRAALRFQNPVVLGEFSEPQPDFTLLRPPLMRYREVHPTPADVLLAVEVADTSGEFDRNEKRQLYAKAGIREYWIVDRAEDCIEVSRNPGPDGYADIRAVRRGEELTVLSIPGFIVPAVAILGPSATPA